MPPRNSKAAPAPARSGRSGASRRTAAEQQAYGAYLLEKLEVLDALLVSLGWPAISAWWWKQLRRFYLSGRRRFVLRVGRRGGKSSTMCRVAVVEALYGEHFVPPGDVGTFLIVAQNTTEASNRLRTIGDILDAMGVKKAPLGGQAVGWEVTSFFSKRRVKFQVFAATVQGVSGPTGIGAIFDEVAKWHDRETGANPATEVLRTARPTMATQPLAKEFMVSSPFSTLDAHYDAFEEGEDEEQLVAQAPTWIANPTLTEEDTRRLEKDFATHQREYGAIPMSAGTVYFFDHQVIDFALTLPLPKGNRRTVAGLDPAFRRNAAACVPTGKVGEIYGPLVAPREIVPQPGKPLVPGPTIRDLGTWAKSHGCDALVSDIHYIDSVIEHATEVGLATHEGFTDKEDAHIKVRAIANAGGFALDGHVDLARQIKSIKQKPLPSGALKIFADGASTSSHADTASAFILAVWFLSQGGGRIYMPPALDTGARGGGGGRWEGMGDRGF